MPREEIVVPLDDVTVPIVPRNIDARRRRMQDDGPNPSGRRTDGLTTQLTSVFTVDDADN